MIMLKNNTGFGAKTPLISSIIAGVIAGICLLGIITPQAIKADFNDTYCTLSMAKVAKTAVQKAAKKIKVIITAYSSTPDQTDDTPFITASGKWVREGIVANNLLPFGTKVRIPALYGEKVFVVEDRMNRRKGNYHLDIWSPSRTLAVNFGVKTAYIEVLED